MFNFNVFIPARVSIVTVVLLVNPLSYTNFPTHLIPFPHISASLPSELNILILKSATLLSHIRISPSDPIPKCLLLTNWANFNSFCIF